MSNNHIIFPYHVCNICTCITLIEFFLKRQNNPLKVSSLVHLILKSNTDIYSQYTPHVRPIYLRNTFLHVKYENILRILVPPSHIYTDSKWSVLPQQQTTTTNIYLTHTFRGLGAVHSPTVFPL